MNHKMIKTYAVTCAVYMLSCVTAMAQITPSDVYQTVDKAYKEIDAFHERDFTATPTVQTNLTPRAPRHVLQKLQEVQIKVQKLRHINGLEEKPPSPIAVQKVTPADVKGAAEVVLAELSTLHPIYGIENVAQAPLPSDKKPTDVYAHLANVSSSLDALGLPAVVPNDVYRLAETVVLDLKQILQHEGLNDNVRTRPVKGKNPAAVYDQTHILLQKLQTLTSYPDYTIKGGVVLLNKPTGKIKPAHVMDSLGNAMAEIVAIKQVSGVKTPTKFAPSPSGKTPSHVYEVVVQAHELVDTLINKAQRSIQQTQGISPPPSQPAVPISPQLAPPVTPQEATQPAAQPVAPAASAININNKTITEQRPLILENNDVSPVKQ